MEPAAEFWLGQIRETFQYGDSSVIIRRLLDGLASKDWLSAAARSDSRTEASIAEAIASLGVPFEALDQAFEKLSPAAQQSLFRGALSYLCRSASCTDTEVIALAEKFVPWAIKKVEDYFPDPTTQESSEARTRLGVAIFFLVEKIGRPPSLDRLERLDAMAVKRKYLVDCKKMLAERGDGYRGEEEQVLDQELNRITEVLERDAQGAFEKLGAIESHRNVAEIASGPLEEVMTTLEKTWTDEIREAILSRNFGQAIERLIFGIEDRRWLSTSEIDPPINRVINTIEVPFKAADVLLGNPGINNQWLFLRVLSPLSQPVTHSDAELIALAQKFCPWGIQKVKEYFPDPTTPEGSEARREVSSAIGYLVGKIINFNPPNPDTLSRLFASAVARKYLLECEAMLLEIGEGNDEVKEEVRSIDEQLAQVLEPLAGDSQILFNALGLIEGELGVGKIASGPLDVFHNVHIAGIGTDRTSPVGPGSATR